MIRRDYIMQGKPDDTPETGAIVHKLVPASSDGVHEQHALCHNGSYHVYYTEHNRLVTCLECLVILERGK